MKKGRLLVLPAKLDYNISLTNIQNLLAATEKIIKADRAYQFDIFNIADDPAYKMDAIILAVFKLLGKEKLRTLRVPQFIVNMAAGLSRRGDLNKNTLKYFLCDQQLDNEKLKNTFQLELPHNFHNYSARLQQWLATIPIADLKKASADLPWRL